MTTALETQNRRSGWSKAGSTKIRMPMILLVMLGVAILLLPELHRPTKLHEPTGYTELVNALLRTGDLRAEDYGEDGGEPFKLADKAAIRNFAKSSFLNTDMLRVSALIWGAEEIQPTAHYETGPRDDFSRWTGDLRFRTLEDAINGAFGGAPRTELIDEKRNLHVTLGRATEDGLQIPSCTFELQGGYSCAGLPDTALYASGTGIIRVQKIFFTRGDENFELLMVGDQPVLHLPPGSAARLRNAIRVNGASIPALGGSGQLYLPLRPPGLREKLLDISLDVQLGDGSRRFRIVERLPLVSRYRTDGSRAYIGSGLETFAKPIEGAMDGRGNLSVQTSLIEEIQTISQSELTKASKPLLNYSPSFRASATLMDGMSGEIAALATFPSRSAGCSAETMDACDTLAQRDRDDRDALHLFETNTNFINLPIGSAAKPPFAVAITDRFPELLGLRIEDPKGDFKCAMGWSFGRGSIEGHGYAGMLDYPHFLAVSSNRYAVALMLLGLKDNGGAKDTYLARSPQQTAASRPLCADEAKAELNGTLMKWRPPFGYMGPGDKQAPWDSQRGGNLSVAGAWRNRFRDWFCIDVVRTGVSGTKTSLDRAGCPPTLWPDGSELANVNIVGVTLTPPNLDMDEVRNRMGDYLFDVLGGGRSRWSTIMLAQAYARIVTGNDVQASLAPRKTPRTNTTLGINPEVRRQTLLGMNLIFSVGTAKDELPKLAQNLLASDGSIFRFYGKTGTPNVVRYTSETKESRALDAFRSCLRGESAGPGQGSRIFVGAPGESVKEAERAVVAHPRCGSRFAAQARMLAFEVARINASDNARHSIVLRGDTVVRLPTQRTTDRVVGDDPSPKGKVFALAAARYPAGTRFDGQGVPPPCSVSVLTVNFQTRMGDRGSPALEFSKAMLGRPETLAWLGRRGSAGCGRVTVGSFAS